MISTKKTRESTPSKKQEGDKDLNHYIPRHYKILTIMFINNVLSFLRLLVNYKYNNHATTQHA